MAQVHVTVLNIKKQFIRYVHPAEARKLVSSGDAQVFSKSPFVIKMNVDYKATKMTAKQTVNFTEYFSTERDVYVQNISNCQVSVLFEIGAGHSESYLFTNSKDPVNLTQEIPFSAIKSSMDIRKMLNRVPPALKLMTEEEYMAYYVKAADVRSMADANEAIADAAKRRVSAQNHIPIDSISARVEEAEKEAKASGEKPEQKKMAETAQHEDDINPRVLNLCLQVHPSLDDKDKISAQTFLVELDSINGLKMIDWEYVLAHGYYKTVKNAAKKRVAELASSEDEGSKEVKVTKKAKKE